MDTSLFSFIVVKNILINLLKLCLKSIIAYFHQAGANYPIVHRNITFNSAKLNSAAILWDSLTTLIETYLHISLILRVKARDALSIVLDRTHAIQQHENLKETSISLIYKDGAAIFFI